MQTKASITENTLSKAHGLIYCPRASADCNLYNQREWSSFCVTTTSAFPMLSHPPLEFALLENPYTIHNENQLTASLGGAV